MGERLPLRWDDPALGRVVAGVARSIADAGGRAWLVGGAVRDALLGAAVTDADLEVHGLDEETLERTLSRDHPLDRVGKAFAVLKLKGWPIDVALPRRERKTGAGHRAFAVQTDPDLDPVVAAARRDFTINAVYCDPLTGELADPLGGVADARARVLRHASMAFGEDPLRVLRGMQLVARFDLEPDPATIALCRTIGFEDLPTERVGAEWDKLLRQGRTPSRGLRFLADTGWLDHFPELAALDPAAWRRTAAALDAHAAARTGEARDDRVVGLAVLIHALEPGDRAGLLARLSHETALPGEVLPLAASLPRVLDLHGDGTDDAAIRRLALAVERIDRLVRLAQATAPAAGRLAHVLDRARQLGVAERPPAPIVLGRHLEALGERPGPHFGPLLHACFEAQLDGVFADEAGGRAYLKALLARR